MICKGKRVHWGLMSGRLLPNFKFKLAFNMVAITSTVLSTPGGTSTAIWNSGSASVCGCAVAWGHSSRPTLLLPDANGSSQKQRRGVQHPSPVPS